MTKKEKINLSIEFKNKKIDILHQKLSTYVEAYDYSKVIDLAEIIQNLKDEIDELNELSWIDDEKEFDSEYDILSKYLEIK